MADEGNEDSWLYGNEEGKEKDAEAAEKDEGAEEEKAKSEEEKVENGETEENKQEDAPKEAEEEEETEEAPNPADDMEEEPHVAEEPKDDENSESESDDDINVVIGDIKSGPSYNIKQRGAAGTGAIAAQATDKVNKPAGKFSIEEFESIGTISGVPALEFSIDSLEDKPWRKPGADITDYFNYGFNEETWRMYCERQKRMRQSESGAGLGGLMISHSQPIMSNVQSQNSNSGRTLFPVPSEHHSKYGAPPGGSMSMLNRRAGPPPGRRMTGPIDVIGGNGMASRRDENPNGKQENPIQVMTAERREYSRVGGIPGKFDVPPPPFSGPPGVVGTNNGSQGGGMVDPFFEPDVYSYGYEPTQDSQWTGNPGWIPTGIKELTPGPPQMVPPPMGMVPPMMGMPPMGMMNPMGNAPRFPNPNHNERGGDRDRDRDRERRGDRDRDRDRSERGRERDRDRVKLERGTEEEGDKERRSKYDRDSSRRRSRERRRRSRSRESRSTRDREPSTASDKPSSEKRPRK